MVNIRKLKAKLVECDVSVNELADIMGVNKATVYRYFQRNGEPFTVKDVDKIAKALKLSYKEVNSIFFNNIVA